MKTTSPRARLLTKISLLAIMLMAAVIVPSAAMATPTMPAARDAYVVTGGTGVTVWWSPSTDGGAPILYDLYRSAVPMTLATATADKLILTTSDTTVTVTPAANEATDKFTYFYVVVARNASTGTKTISANVSPNVHGGGWRTGFNVNNCTLCHTSVHGAGAEYYLGAATRYKCYRCHGNTTATTDYGAKAIRNVQRDFYDYPAGQTIPATVSRHYNGHNITDQTECTMCHTPHKSPHYVDASGVYQSTISYTQLLRAQRADLSYVYSTDSSPLGNNFCFECHGTNATTLDYNAGTGAYTRAGGDHQTPYAAPATAAHNATVVLTNTTATNPGIQCEACHNKHAAAAGGLADWRSQGTTDPTVNNQAGLCFQCHKTNSAESTYLAGSRISGSSAPYSWRGTSLVADIYDQFKNAARKSTHPLSAGSGRWVATGGTVFSQTTKAEFDTDIPVQTVVNTADGDGSVVLNTFDTLTPIPPERFMFYQRSASMVVDAYEYDTGASGTWNTPYNPADETSFNTATGSNLFAAGGNIYRTRGGGSTTLPMIRQFTLGTDTDGAWGNTSLTTTFNAAFGAGSAVAVNEAGTVAYLSAGGSSNVINWWDFPANSENSMTFSGGTLNSGSGIAYTPAADRLWVVNRDTTSGNGRLYFLAVPGVKTGAQTFTDTTLVLGPTGTTQRWGRLTNFKSATGTDFLAYMGRNDTARVFSIVSNLGVTTPTKLDLTGTTKEPSGGGTLADGCSLQWDGVPGGYIYATLGGTSTVIKRIRIPADPTVDGGATGWGTWETLTNPLPAAAGAGADITFAMVDRPGSVTAPNYYADGTVTTGDIQMPSTRNASWGTLTWNGVQNAPTTTVSVTLEYSTDNWATKTTMSSLSSGASLAAIPAAAKVHLIGNLHTGDVIGSTPRLDDWSITGTWDEYETGSYGNVPETAFSQTAQTEFTTDTLFQTNTAVVPGSVVLATQDVSTPIPPEKYLFYGRGAVIGVTDAYQLATGATGTWNTPYNPGDDTGGFQVATGSSWFTAGGNVYYTRGGNSTTNPMIRKFTLGPDSNGTWSNAGITVFNTGFTTGSDAAVNAKDSVVYLTQSGGTNVINWWQYSGATENGMTFSGGTLGIGSSIAYTPDADRLWVVLRNGTTGAGTLWRLNAPGVKFGAQTFTDTTVVAGPYGGTSYYSDMVYFENAAGTDFLGNMGRDTAGRYFNVISNLGVNTPTLLRLTGTTKEPSGGGALGDGCDLEWDGVPGGYIYATLGGTSTTVKRIRIPEDPTVDGGTTGWGTWETMTNLPATGAVGMGITVATVDRPGSTILPNYYADGTVTTGDIVAPVGAVGWGTLTWNGVQNAPTTTVSVTLEYSTDNWATKTTHTSVPSGTDLAVLGVPLTAKVHLIGNLHTGDVVGSTPRLDDWSITTLKEVFIPAGSLTCYNCHNTHAVEKGAAGVAWDLSRVSNPDDIQSNFDDVGTTVGAFCLKCHDGTAPSDGANSPTTFVPYAVGFRTFDAVASPFFFGRGLWNKSSAGAAWTGSAHDSAGAIAKDCGTCHDPHSSNFDNLTAYTGGTTVRANTDAAVSKEENLCYAANGCHNSAATTRNVQTPMAATYSHTAENVADKHSDTEGAAGLGLGDLTNRHSECADCHDPHAAKAGIHATPGTDKVGSSDPGAALLGAGGIKPTFSLPAFKGGTESWAAMNTPTIWDAERMTGEVGTDLEVFVCLKCHSGYSDSTLPHSVTNGGRTYTATDVALEFNPSNFAVHNVFGQKVGVQEAFTYVASDNLEHTNTWTFPTTNVFRTDTNYGPDTMLTCTSCHTNETAGAARGPHGSTAQWLIDPAYGRDWRTVGLGTQGQYGMVYMNGTTVTAADDVICAKCHDLYSTNWAHEAHSRSDHWRNADNTRCVDCHIAIPHGWKTPRLLISGTVDSAYLAPYPGRATTAPYTLRIQANVNYTPNGWSKSRCGAQGACSTHSNPATYWP